MERKGIEYIRENFHAHFAPLKIMGYDVRREDVEIREPPDESRR